MDYDALKTELAKAEYAALDAAAAAAAVNAKTEARAVLLALGATSVDWGTEHLGSPVTGHDVQVARSI